nr:MADS-box protein AGL71-like [Ipomoea batatas]
MQAVVKKRKIERRKEALFKKAEEISMLCGSEIGIVIVSPTERDPIIWPEVEAMTNIFSEFMEVPEEERVKRMVLHEEYMRVKVIAGRRNLTEMDARQLKGLYALADDKMVELEKRKQDFPATVDDGGAARNHRRRERNLAPVAAVSGGADGGGSYYVPQPPAPAAGELLPATWIWGEMEMKRQEKDDEEVAVQGGQCKEKEIISRRRRRRGLPVVGKALLRKLVFCGGRGSPTADEIISDGKEVMAAVDTYFSIPVLPGPSQWYVKSSAEWY